MWPDLWFRSCVGLWSIMAQAGVPTTAPAGPAAPAPAGAPPTVPVPVATAVPMGVPGGTGPVVATEPFHATPSLVTTLSHGFVLSLYFVICAALIVCVMFQTTKSEGLSGVIGGTASSSLFKGKKSAEETLTMWTSRLAVAFLVFSFFIWYWFSRNAG